MDKVTKLEYLRKIESIKPSLDDEHRAKLVGIEWFLRQDKDYRIKGCDIDEVIDLVKISQFVNGLKK